MKIYFVCTTEWDYDEYDSFVIVAKTKKDAMNLVMGTLYNQKNSFRNIDDYEVLGNYTGKRKDEHIVLASFNAG